MSNLVRFVVFALLIFQFQHSVAQDIITDFESFTVKEGLSQTTINCIFQDSRGYLWIGTQDGLNRYDGYSFKTYSQQAFDPKSISNNFINCIVEDKNGFLWIGTNGGLNKFDRNKETFVSYRHDPRNSFSIASDEIHGMLIDRNGIFWIKTSETLDRMDFSTSQFFHYPYFNNLFNLNSDIRKFPILEDYNGRMWVGTKDGLNFFDRGLTLFDRFEQGDKDPGKISCDFITALAVADKDNIWVGSNKGLFLFNANAKRFEQLSYLKNLSDKSILSILSDKFGNIWCGTTTGLYFQDRNTKEFRKINQVNDSKYNIQQATVNCLFSDASGIIWVGTNNGLLKINIRPKRFKLYSSNGDYKIKLTSNDIASFFEEDKNTLWIGTWGAGLNILDLTTNTVQGYNLALKEHNPNWNYIHSIYRDKNKKIWLGTRDGVVSFDKTTGKAVSLCEKIKSTGCNILNGNRISQIVEDNTGYLWFASYYGLLRFNSPKGIIDRWTSNSNDSISLPSNIFNCITKDSKGNFWVGSEKGLVFVDPITRKIENLSTKYEENAVTQTAIYCIAVDEAHKAVWAGSSIGLIKFDMQGKFIRFFTENDGLSDNQIYAIQKDNSNNLWFSTNHGINKFNIPNETVVSYDLADGLQNYEYNLGASLKTEEGFLLFGGISGFNQFYPDSLMKHGITPQIALTSIQIIDKKGNASFIKPENNVITIPYGTYLLTIDFAALDYTFPYKNKFRYKFYSGEETEWVNFDTKHSATFTNLKPGKYKFKLIGSNSELLWSDKSLEYDVIVESPFWLSTDAYYVYGILAVMLFFLIYQLRTYQLRRSNRLLKEKERIASEIESQREELSIKNKNITDSINYAKRIQEALMPSEKQIKKAFPHSFVLHKPKDIVSGDFYWISERNDKIFVAAIDCTGHGVPGAFMSIIGFELFRKVTGNQKIESAGDMLTMINHEFESIFKDVENFTLRDGMDIAFVMIDKKSRELEFSGAINPMYLIRNNKIQEIRGSRFSIGIDEDSEVEQTFVSNKVQLLDDDIIYLFSDGYADQFGGPDGKKFKYRRFRHLLLTIHKFPLDEQLRLLDERIEAWKGDLEQVDDILLIGIKPFSKD